MRYPAIISVITIILAIAATVAALIFIVPQKKREKLNKFGKWLHDLCNFRLLLIEYIFKTLYIFLTATCIIYGFFMLFYYQSYGYFGGHYYGGYGLLIMILGPIVIRIAYELMMMFIILVKTTIDIKNKLYNGEKSGSDSLFGDIGFNNASAPEPEHKPDMIYCTQCGTYYDKAKGDCPNPNCPTKH